MKTRRLTTAGALACLFGNMVASGQSIEAPEDFGPTSTQIAWASEAFATNLRADGVTTFESAGDVVRFELGVFSPGFDPLTATPDEWVSGWIVLQGVDYDLNDQQFIETATLASNDAPFQVGAPVYIWGYTTKTPADGAEWLLVSSPVWQWPAVDAPLPTTFSMSDALPAHALFGAVNAEDGSYHMRLAVVAVPEPSGVVLAACGLLVFASRRRR